MMEKGATHMFYLLLFIILMYLMLILNLVCVCLCVFSYKEFEEVIYQWRLKGGEFQDDYPWKVSDADLASHKEKVRTSVLLPTSACVCAFTY